MENKEFIDRIRDLVAEGETEKSVDELYLFVKEIDNEMLDRLVLLRNRMKKLQRDVQSGTLDEENEYQERAKINEAVLMLLRQLTPGYLSIDKQVEEQLQSIRTTPSYKPSSPAKNMKTIYLVGGGIAVVAILVFLLRGAFGGSDGTTGTVPNSLTTTIAPQVDVYPKWAIVQTKSGDDLRIRTKPSEQSNVLMNVPHGAKVKIVGADENYSTLRDGQYGKWLNVEYSDGKGRSYHGWTWGGYLKLTEE